MLSGPRDVVRRLWHGPGGGRRLFLTWYSAEAVAGAVTGLFTTLAVMALFSGTGEYLTTFIAQYLGAGRPLRIGPVMWQGFYFALGAGVVIAALSPLVGPIFALAGHDPAVQRSEVTFATILMRGALPVVLAVNVVSTAADIVLDALWIFGRGGFPRWGVAGAAWATVAAQALGATIFAVLILRPSCRRAYATVSGWRFDPALFLRLLRYGLPSGLQYSLEILAFAIFMMIVGRLGTAPLAASGITFNLNMIVFMPMLGLGVAVSAVVGRYLGADQPHVAERATWSAFWMSLVYMTACGALYLLAPHALLFPYAAGADPAVFAEIERISVVLLRFVALYSLFDMMNVIFAAALRGAGDTFYTLALTVVLSWAAMLAPAYLVCVVGGGGVYAAWMTASAYIVLLGILMMRRFRAGRWRALRVIEPPLSDLEVAAAG